jgi:hypothetical protein
MYSNMAVKTFLVNGNQSMKSYKGGRPLKMCAVFIHIFIMNNKYKKSSMNLHITGS